jgi:nitrite reductase/ring-hydroxylating ferredoxin subunit
MALVFGLVVVLGVLQKYFFDSFAILYAIGFIFGFQKIASSLAVWYLGDRLLKDAPSKAGEIPRECHDRMRELCYPTSTFNTWYHVCDADELDEGKVLEVRVLNLTLAVWKTKDGTPVCQSAFCLHLGANIAVGGKVVDDCVQCPFHKWKFNKDGTINEIPYIPDPKLISTNKSLKTYPCVEWCGLIYFYFHAEDKPPEFELPAFLPKEMKKGKFTKYVKWNMGYHPLSPIDWVDQAGSTVICLYRV